MLLIGTNNWKLAVPRKLREGKWNDPIASKCILGWGLQGSGYAKTAFSMHHCQCNWEEIDKTVKESFNVDSVTPRTLRSIDDEKALQILDSTCTKVDGHYQVGLLWRHTNPILPESYNSAMKRLDCLKSKISREPDLYDKIELQINNLLEKGYAVEMSSAEMNIKHERVWYLPIFITHNPNKPEKVRLVWDAAAKSHGKSLNDFMVTGPDLLHPLTEVLMAFRVGKIAVCGDIAEMFHQIRIQEADSHAQRFIWFNKETRAPRIFVMKAMTFGISCAPCIAHYVRDKNAKEYKLKSPRAFEAITEAHYVDDYIDSLADETEAIKVSLEVRDIHAAGGFNIRNWASNSPEVLKHLLGDSITLQPAKELGDAEKVLDFTELHTFVDASEFGYAAVCYFRIGKGDDITISLVAAKSKVAPLKPLSIPRMELLAALTGARLSQKVRNTRNIKADEHIYWTDSRTVISWLTMDPRNFYAFVMHRVGEIMETTNASQWHWVPTKLNVADMATKFTSKPNPEEWVNGPHFLRQSRDQWPKQPDVCNFPNVKCDEIRRTVLVMRRTSVKAIPLNVECISDWKRLYRATATFLLKAQQDGFKTELDTLQSSQNITKPSALIGFNVYIDDEGIMRTQGRADSINQNRDQIVLPKHNHITHLVVKDFHEKNHHMLHEGTINLIRSMYFIPQLRIVYKSVRKSCQICKNNSAIPEPPQMASLPPARIASFERPFTYTGVDFFGPILVTVGRHKEKRWGVIFTCLTLRAVHIEIAYSLDTSSCVMCLTNFMSRRGTPKEIFSDNGTNFRATEKIVKEELKNIDFGKLVIKYDQIRWRFNPPAAPHMGGAWERLIRSIKLVIKSISPNSNYNDESLRNALLSAEYVINSRPLTFVSLEAEDDDALTPNHLLLGSADGYKPTVTTELNPRQRWCQAQELADLFWKRWVKEYMPIITRRSKWFPKRSPLAVGDIVIIVDENLPRNLWPKGRITEVTTAKDGQVRSATIKTQHGIMVRPATKIAVLDVLPKSK
ncbi:uncharacterized protein LOC128251924 [Drosophila gunungcola]|uniref:uncharacterized protein LOC128251924 n=1 Tax=Drosophila gunungcola TaxID=103775 RepID=UPI0022E0F2E3|nr:uncharacterized protein LOC128251924 [Drosophila gunungcola]